MEDLKKKYTGKTAHSYENKRIGRTCWEKEQQVVCSFLKRIKERYKEEDLTVLDIPVGTGRFFEFYKELGFSVIGLDISGDMLALAKKKSESLNLKTDLRRGDITKIDSLDNVVDLVVSIRIFNLMNTNNTADAMSEISRITRKYIICGVGAGHSLQEISFKNLVTYIRRFSTKIYYFIKRDQPFRHREEDIFDIFEKNNLKIIEKERIDNGRSGFSYFIYLLEKS